MPPGDASARRAEVIARAFHAEYEHLAPAYGYETRRESAVDWEDVPEQNRKLMIHVVGNLLASDVIAPVPEGNEPSTTPAATDNRQDRQL